MIKKRIFRVVVFLILLMGISIVFLPNIHLTPQGNVGTIDYTNVFVSVFFIIAWLFLAIYSGYKKILEIFIAAIIYSLLPVFLFVKAGNNVGIPNVAAWVWTLPLQGLLFDDIYMVVLAITQPLTFALGYMIGLKKRKANIKCDKEGNRQKPLTLLFRRIHMRKKQKLVILMCLGIFVLLLIIYSYYFIYGFEVASDSLYISNINITSNYVHISGDTSSSALGFSGYNTKLDGKQLLIKPRYSMVSPFNKYGKFEIKYGTKGKTIDKIFFIGKGENDKKQIWSTK
ncbi:MAG: hypothetical protein JL50_08965 [Peptococcaceae bacterium BICA1-7]|nr:MAG: hypothetical protein JL50_08965 [Peptococcaceae bacterium BICA1-7]HBV97191.1 hypothetical protein [Desulfotomaculum sp.]